MGSAKLSILLLLCSVTYGFADEAFCGQVCSADIKCTTPSCGLCAKVGKVNYCIRGRDVNATCKSDNECYPLDPDGNQVLCVNGTCKATSREKSAAKGYIGIAVAALFFGTNFLPVKKFDAGDGMFFQWVMCSAILIMGAGFNIYRGMPQFHPMSMLGGAIWCTGNIMVVPTVKLIGLALGMAIWNSTNILAGWATAYFGIFIRKSKIEHLALNFIGVGFSVLAAILFTLVKPSVGNEDVAESQPLNAMHEDEEITLDYGHSPKKPASSSSSSGGNLKVIGLALAVLQGLFYGINFTPPLHQIKNQFAEEKTNGRLYSTNGMDYVFSHFTGIFCTSTLYLAIYCAINKNKPSVNPKIILPGLVSGLMWATAQIGFFVANDNLSPAVSFPIIGTVPSVLSALFGVILFKEIQGQRNFIILGLGFTCVACTAGFIAASN